jgi:ribosomal protein S27E
MTRNKGPMDKFFGKNINRFIMDTGPQEKGKYRVIADLHKMKCPRCENIHFSAAKFGPYCIDCAFIVSEEKKLGRELTKKEKINMLLDANLLDKSNIKRWLKQAEKKKDAEFIDFFKKMLEK